ncbi:MAG: hypothetical protein C0507_15935 [Cyanobacteria bacterium PR.3.49]|nr:hypothetical protein [Cyanobacteria bacterium PR.3.49]
MPVLDNNFDSAYESSARAQWLNNVSVDAFTDNSVFQSKWNRTEPTWLGGVELYDSSQTDNARVAQETPSDGATSTDGSSSTNGEPTIPRQRPVDEADAPQPYVPVEPPHAPVGTTSTPEEWPHTPKRPHIEVDHVNPGEPAPQEPAYPAQRKATSEAAQALAEVAKRLGLKNRPVVEGGGLFAKAVEGYIPAPEAPGRGG